MILAQFQYGGELDDRLAPHDKVPLPHDEVHLMMIEYRYVMTNSIPLIILTLIPRHTFFPQ